MAQKKKVKKAGWLKTALIYTFFPLFVWSLAFVAWLYWDSVAGLFSQDKAKARPAPRAARQAEKSEQASGQRSQEKILDDDRKKLEDILKKR